MNITRKSFSGCGTDGVILRFVATRENEEFDRSLLGCFDFYDGIRYRLLRGLEMGVGEEGERGWMWWWWSEVENDGFVMGGGGLTTRNGRRLKLSVIIKIEKNKR